MSTARNADPFIEASASSFLAVDTLMPQVLHLKYRTQRKIEHLSKIWK